MRRIHLIGTSLLAVAVAHPAYAQSTPQTAQTTAPDDDEIIVTATKREQTLQDVPISVSVTSAATIEKAQVRDLIDLQSVVPSLKVAQLNASGQTLFIIRGFGNGNGNDGIENSVGIFIDGIYRSRSAAGLDDLPEIERVEVLRGPQSTLFGKNVSAGAISIVTKKPQFDFGMKAEISLGNYNLINPRLSITGPISETIAVRLSGSVNERSGYFNNVVTGGKINDRNRWSVRGDVLWQPSADFSLRVIGDYNLIKEVCCGVAQIFNGPATQFIGAPPPFGLGKTIGNTANIFARNVVFDANPQNRVRGEGISAQADWNIGFAKLTSITAYRNQVNQSNQDIDFSGADLATNQTANEIKTFTQELRLASTGDGPLSWLIGGFYQKEKTDTGRDISFGRDIRGYADGLSGRIPAPSATAPLGAVFPNLVGRSNIYALEFLQGLVTPSIVPGQTYFQPGVAIHDFYKLDQTSYSIFGQVDFKVTDNLTITGGLAYLNDRKNASSQVVLNDAFSKLNLQAIPQFPLIPRLGLPGNAFGPLGALQFYYGDTPNHGPVQFGNPGDADPGIFKGDKFTYAARAAYDFGAVNVYVSYSTGWKASAVNLSSDSRPALNGVGRGAGPENVTVYEAGLKAKFSGGYFNLAVFKETIKGFQSNAFTGLGYSLVNAGQESVKGFEVDAAYRPIPWLSLSGSVTYLDPKYDSFTGAPCVNYDTVRCPLNLSTGLRPPFRNLTGEKPAGITKWSFSGSATINHDFGNGLSGYARGEYDYGSDTFLTETTPQNLATWGVSTVNASLGVADANAQLEVMVWARNLNNDKTLLSTFPTVVQTGSYSGYPNQPRTYGVTVRKTF